MDPELEPLANLNFPPPNIGPDGQPMLPTPNPSERYLGTRRPAEFRETIENVSVRDFVPMLRGIHFSDEYEGEGADELYFELLMGALESSEDPADDIELLRSHFEIYEQTQNADAELTRIYPYHSDNAPIKIEITDMPSTVTYLMDGSNTPPSEEGTINMQGLSKSYNVPEHENRVVETLGVMVGASTVEKSPSAGFHGILKLRPGAITETIDSLIGISQLHDYFGHIPELHSYPTRPYVEGDVEGFEYTLPGNIKVFFGLDLKNDMIHILGSTFMLNDLRELEESVAELLGICDQILSPVLSNAMDMLDSDNDFGPVKINTDTDSEQRFEANMGSELAIDDYQEALMANCRKPLEGITFNDMYGADELTEQICGIIHDERFREHYEQMGYNYKKVLGFFGEKGSGKTMTAKAIATELNATQYFEFESSDLNARVYGAAPQKIAAMFKLLNALADRGERVVAVLEECDSLLPKRKKGGNSSIEQEYRAIVNTFLKGLDNIHPNVTFIFTSNDRDHMDDTVFRTQRVRKTFKFEKPTLESTTKIMSGLIDEYNNRPGIVRYDTDSAQALAEMAMKRGLSPSDIRTVFEEAGMSAIRQHIDEGATEAHTLVTFEQLLKQVNELSDDDVDKRQTGQYL